MIAVMRVERARFLELTLLLSAVACDDRSRAAASPTVPAAAGPVALVIPPMADTASPVSSGGANARPPGASTAKGPTCNTAPADLAACRRVSPTCEGLSEECEGLAESFQPRVAEAIALCMAKSRAASCRPKSLGACMRKAIEAACIEPDAVEACAEVMRACRAAGKTPRYTAEQCAAIVSSAPNAAGERMGSDAWSEAMLETLGPTSEDKSCALDYVLAYQPWGISWK
jgi:hypothetical protein